MGFKQKQQHPEGQMQGCPSSSSFDDDFETGGVRCCSMDGSDGNSGNFPRTRTFPNGAQYVQADDSQCAHEREPCASTSFNCGGTWHQAIYRNRARAATSDGCLTSNYAD